MAFSQKKSKNLDHPAFDPVKLRAHSWERRHSDDAHLKRLLNKATTDNPRVVQSGVAPSHGITQFFQLDSKRFLRSKKPTTKL